MDVWLILEIDKWIKRIHGEVNYYLTPFFSGNVGYSDYLYVFKLDTSPECQNLSMQKWNCEEMTSGLRLQLLFKSGKS